MKYISLFILAFLFGTTSVLAYQVGNGSWLTVSRADGTYRIYNGCGTTIWFPENSVADFARATTSNIRTGCVRVHKAINPVIGVVPCPTGSTVLNNDYWTRLTVGLTVPFSGPEMRCDFLP